MNTYVPTVDSNDMVNQNKSLEVVNAEKQLWALIHSKGLLQIDVQDLYHQVRSAYEDMILNDLEMVGIQDVEHCLWKLHYKHIDEFRRRLRQFSSSAKNKKSGAPQDVATVQNSIDDHMEGFRSFLSEASEFYKDLITKVKNSCGLPEEMLLANMDDSSSLVEPTKFHKCQYTCHRFLICLGDLARYKELCQKSDNRNCKWSVAASYYFEAGIICPESGNPHNQLALLATYVCDDFLALYHCVRSLAVKEPFPDAWDNLMLLFEKNRSYKLHSLSRENHFDLLKPFERSCSRTKSDAPGGSSDINKNLEANEHVLYGVTDLWPLFIRMTSFFFVKSSSEDFYCVFASTMRKLEALLEFREIELKASLESYGRMDSSRRGPHRALQLVAILIFIIDNLAASPEAENPIEKTEIQQSDAGQLAWTATFIVMGRLVERCMKGSQLDGCPLLVSVLVFVEWLVGKLEKAAYGSHENVRSATSYFFGVFCNLLNQLDSKEGEVKFVDHTALWEDYELRGFSPLVHAHEPLDFSAQSRHMRNYENRYTSRAHRILHAAMKIVERSNNSWKWMSYDKLGRKFCAEYPKKIPHQNEAEAFGSSSKTEVEHANIYENDTSEENQGRHVNVEYAGTEDEEVILFKPISRQNSEPIYASDNSEKRMPSTDNSQQTGHTDDILCRATSLFLPPKQTQIESSDFHPDTTESRFSIPHKQQDPILKDPMSYPVGPPSLSGWVLNRESMHVEREKGTRDFHRTELSPIEEIPSASLAGLSINEKDFSSTIHNSSPPYVVPMPSAPQLPHDAIWLRGYSSSFPESKTGVGMKETEGILGASPVSAYSNLSPHVPSFVDGYPPLFGLSSSEGLYQYRNTQNLEQTTSHISPVQFNTPGEFGNIHGHEASRFDLFDRWGNPLASNQMLYLDNPPLHQGLSVYAADEQRREKHFLGNYQRPSSYGCGLGTDFGAEQHPPLLQYLQDREWQLLREYQMRSPTYMGN